YVQTPPPPPTYTLSLHDALPISRQAQSHPDENTEDGARQAEFEDDELVVAAAGSEECAEDFGHRHVAGPDGQRGQHYDHECGDGGDQPHHTLDPQAPASRLTGVSVRFRRS